VPAHVGEHQPQDEGEGAHGGQPSSPISPPSPRV
jgi:hypothetical protein